MAVRVDFTRLSRTVMLLDDLRTLRVEFLESHRCLWIGVSEAVLY